MRNPKSDRFTTPVSLSALTQRQIEVFDFIRSFRIDRGTSPSYEEIAEHLGDKSTKSIARTVRELVAVGAMVCQRGKARTAVPVTPNTITVDLPDRLQRAVRVIAERARTTPAAVVAEAVHERLSGICDSLEPPSALPRPRRRSENARCGQSLATTGKFDRVD